MARLVPRWALLPTVLLGACVAYEPAPAEPGEILAALELVRLDAQTGIAAVGTAVVDPSDGLSLLEATAVAVHLNPAVRARRAEVGVARAQLVEAGLLPDPVIGWDAMNVVADFATDGKSSANSYVAGLSLSWDVPRWGEIDAREGVGRARVRGAQAGVLRAEWELVREVHLAFLALAAAQEGLAINAEQVAITARTVEWVEKARAAGAATTIEERLARVERDRLRADRMRLEQEESVARHGLIGLLGLPPETTLLLQEPAEALSPSIPPLLDPRALAIDASRRRPDLAELEAFYAAAEDQLRLEVTRQFPQVSIGTGIGIQLPIFSRLNHPAIDTAEQERTAAAERLRAGVHEARRAVHAAHASLVRAQAQVAFNETELRPGLDELLRLTRAALDIGEVTPREVLAVQGQTLATQLELLAARRRRAAAWIELQAAYGGLLPQRPDAEGADDDDDAD